MSYIGANELQGYIVKFKFICIEFVEVFFFSSFFRKADQGLQTVRTKGKFSGYLSICLRNMACFGDVLYLLTKNKKRHVFVSFHKSSVTKD